MKKVFLSMIALVAVAVLVAQLRTNPSKTEGKASRVLSSNTEGDEHEAEDSHGAEAWRMKMLVDPSTGKLNYKAIAQAREEYKTNMHNVDRGASLNISWEELGPDNIGGRTRSIIMDNQVASGLHLIAGSVSGGVWLSDNGGESWHQNPDWPEDFKSVPVGSLAQAPDGHIYLGTGEGLYPNYDFGGGGVPGDGVWESTDGGNTFTVMPGTSPSVISPTQDWAHENSLAVDPSDSKVYAATTGGIEIYDGSTWSFAPGLGNGMGFDVEITNDGSAVYAVYNNRVYRSTDHGASWTNLSDPNMNTGLPISSRVELAVSPSSPNFVYAAIANPSSCLFGVYQTQDGGDHWTQIGAGGSQEFDPFSGGSYCQGDYDNAIAVDPKNPNRIFMAGLTLWTWSNTNSWKQVDALGGEFFSPFYIHADKHQIVFDQHDASGNTMYVTCDGGIFKSVTAQSDDPQFQEMNKGYNVTQFYGVGANRSGEVGGGTQDNGTNFNDFANNTKESFSHILGGDGGMFEISGKNPEIMFGELPYGEIQRSGNGGETFSCFFDSYVDASDPPDCLPDENASFVAPIVLWEDPNSTANILIAGFSGTVWCINDPENLNNTPHWFRLTRDINSTSGDITGTVEALATSADASAVYVGTDQGKLYRINGLSPNLDFYWNDNGTSNTTADDYWDSMHLVTHSDIGGGTVSGHVVTGIAVDQNNADHIVVVLGGYYQGNHVLESFNATAASPTFTSIQGDLPKMPVYDAVIDIADPNNIIIATDLGVWSTNDGSTWTSANAEIGTVPCFQLRQIPYRDGNCRALYLASHGRGLWRSGSLMANGCTLFGTGVDETTVGTFNVYPNPAQNYTNLSFTLQSTTDVKIEIFDITGRKMKNIDAGSKSSGSNVVSIDTKDLSSGTYFIRLSGNATIQVAKLVISK